MPDRESYPLPHTARYEGGDRNNGNEERRLEFTTWRAEFEKQQAVRDKHVDDRFNAQDRILEQIRDYLAFGRVGSRIVMFFAVLGGALAAIWAAWHPPK